MEKVIRPTAFMGRGLKTIRSLNNYRQNQKPDEVCTNNDLVYEIFILCYSKKPTPFQGE